MTDETIAALLEERLSVEEVRAVAQHIDSCTECRRIVAEVAREARVSQTMASPTAGGPQVSSSGDREKAAAPPSAQASAEERPPGATVGRYVIVEPIGAGGMGVVYLARDPELGRKVALKLLHANAHGRASSRGRARLLREAQAMAQLSHPNVITIYDVGTTDLEDVFLAMELVDGGTLAGWMRADGHSWRDVVAMLRRAGDGLAAAHAAGIVHRDFKPDNVLVGSDGRVRVTDFGLARTAGDPGLLAELLHTRPADLATSMTQTGAVVGTPAYMAPEQLSGGVADKRSDVFSFCVTFYEALYGSRPFVGSTAFQLREAIEQGAIRSAPARTLVPKWLRRIVLSGLQANADARPQSVNALLEAIDRRMARGKRSIALRALATAALGAAAAGGMLVATRAREPRNGRGPAAATSAPSKPLTLTDAPLPASRNQEALRAYRAALQKQRDGINAVNELARAAELDPDLAAAHLRLALLTVDRPTKAREHLARAVTLRASLTDRDQLILAAASAWIQADPPDANAFASAMSAALERFPFDAELAYWAYNSHDPYCGVDGADADREKMAEFSARALKLDPAFGQVYVQRLCDAVESGDVDAIPQALRDCDAHAPHATDCLVHRLEVEQADGNCTELEHTARALLAREDPSDPSDASYYLAEAAYAQGQPIETVRGWVEQLARSDRYDMFHVGSYLFSPDILTGDFEAVKRRADDVERAHASDSALYWHGLAARRRIFASFESGQLVEAARLSQDYLRHKGAWVADWGGVATPWALSLERRAGLLPVRDFEDQRQRWVDEATRNASSPSERWQVWVQGYAAISETATEAVQALDAQSKFGAMPRSVKSDSAPTGGSSDTAAVGKAYVLAGRAAEGLPLLMRYTRSCMALRKPWDHTIAHLFLGEALASLGRHEEACAAYSVVLSRWGHAKPRSVTAERARTLARASGCPAAP